MATKLELTLLKDVANFKKKQAEKVATQATDDKTQLENDVAAFVAQIANEAKEGKTEFFALTPFMNFGHKLIDAGFSNVTLHAIPSDKKMFSVTVRLPEDPNG